MPPGNWTKFERNVIAGTRVTLDRGATSEAVSTLNRLTVMPSYFLFDP